MKRITVYFITAVSFLLAAIGCKEDELLPELEGSGVSEYSWEDKIVADEEGEMLSLTFTSAAKWTAESTEPSWCQILTSEGVAGQAALRISVAVNTEVEPRSAEVAVQVEGYPVPQTFTVSQKAGVVEKGNGVYREVNEWIYRRMSEVYLWNEPIPELALDYSIDYKAFLKSVLDGVADHDDINHDDGAYNQELRTEYYTRIESSAPVTKVVGSQQTGNGFFKLRPVDIGVAVGILVEAVVPGGPAEAAGVARGHFITAVNGVNITRDNYKTVATKIYTDPVNVALNNVTWKGENRDQAVVKLERTVDLMPSTYVDPAIYKAETVELSDGKKVGYLLYMGFHTDFDKQLFDVFDKFKEDGVEDLVLDLRYNNGGEILSSTVLSTLIAGPLHQGKTLAKLTFNAARTAAGESAEYKIGVAETLEYPSGYQPIKEALQHSLGLKRVFIIATGVTASASEIVINGLRGLDIEVNLIGTKTSGKNVGMEGFMTSYRNYDFLLYPVSFYIENAKGFRDYPEGFEPDLRLDDSSFYPGGDFGDNSDFLCNSAYGWIRTGTKPSRVAARECAVALPGVQESACPRMGGSLVIYRE